MTTVFSEKENANSLSGRDYSPIPVATEVSLHLCSGLSSVLMAKQEKVAFSCFMWIALPSLNVSDEKDQVSLQVSSERNGVGIWLETSWRCEMVAGRAPDSP